MSDPEPARASSVVGVVALGLVFVALLTPNQRGALHLAVLASIPVELLLGGLALLSLPAPARRGVATALGLVLGVLTIGKIADLGFYTALARPFDPALDWSLIDDASRLLADTIGRSAAVAIMIIAVIGLLAVLVVCVLAVRYAGHVATAHRSSAHVVLISLTAGWLACATLGVQAIPGVPLAGSTTTQLVGDRAHQILASVQDRQQFDAQAATDAFAGVPDGELLSALHDKDVVIVFVESYGRSAIDDPGLSPGITDLLDAGDRRLNAAGVMINSAYLTSPTAGGSSWLAHSTLLSGLRIDSQQRYRTLMASDRLTLTSAFRRTRCRTVAVVPGITTAWPEARFFGFDQVYDTHQLGYHGPRFGWAPVPDQFTLAAFDRLERGRSDRGQLMAQISLVSSHAPWAPVPSLVDWGDLGDGSIFGAPTGPGDPPEAILTRDPGRVRSDYARSIAYSLDSVISWVEDRGDDDLVVIMLGDHQPSPVVTGGSAGRDVPISIITRDRAVLSRVGDWHWSDGLTPRDDGPVWPMEAFRDRFLTAFG